MEYFTTEKGKLYCGKSENILKDIPDNSISTVITDPPYGLSNHSEKLIREVLSKWIAGDESYIPSLKGFMGKTWDAFIPPPALWKEVLRVMKPGGTALVFAGSRTQDLMSMSLRLAGFEIKDTLMYLYGSGFPKATDIGKQLDRGKRKLIGVYKTGYSKSQKECGYRPKEYECKIYNNQPVTPEAKQWDGYKSHGLKPAYEPIIMAIKSNEGSYTQNALKWDVSGLNIDAGRIPCTENLYKAPSVCNNSKKQKTNFNTSKLTGSVTNDWRKGRFPANIILECICDDDKHTNPECPCYMLDEQSGVSISKGGNSTNIGGFFTTYSDKSKIGVKCGFNDKGGASRFFYCVKASKKERNMGCKKLAVEKAGGMSGRNDDSFNGKITYNQNHHSTVKPLKLMEYLIKLTKMPNDEQIYLDPFIGSGTTAIACEALGRKWIGIEVIEEYCQIAKARIKGYYKC